MGSAIASVFGESVNHFANGDAPRTAQEHGREDQAHSDEAGSTTRPGRILYM